MISAVMSDPQTEREATIHQTFQLFDDEMSGELNAVQLQAAHEMIRMDGISIPQVCHWCSVIWDSERGMLVHTYGKKLSLTRNRIGA